MRFHTGFMADEWRVTAQTVGFDLGAYCEETDAEDNVHQMLRGASPIAAVQHEMLRGLQAENDDLKAGLVALQAEVRALRNEAT